MKKNEKGFMLAETLLVTAFVAGVLIYLYIQFTSLSGNYSDAYNYNTVEDLYALADVVEFISKDPKALTNIRNNISENKYIDISNCTLFTEQAMCMKLLELENINEIIITTNTIPKDSIKDYSAGFIKFVSRINASNNEPYRVVASFKNNTYATLRFGDTNE